MRPPIAAAATCATLLSLASLARAGDVPQPESRTVILPPAQEAPPPDAGPAAEPALPPAPAPHRPALGFQLRGGSAEVDRFTLGSSFVASSGLYTFGVSGDMTLDARGGGHHYGRDDYDHGRGWNDWCTVRSDGRCLNRADLFLSGFAGVRHRTAPVLGGSRLRLELVGEVGWQWSVVDERISGTSGTYWSDGSRAFPFAGVRAGVGFTFLRNAYVGVGGYARQGLAGRLCVDTDGGCTRVGGASAGVLLLGGAEWGGGD